MYGYHPGSKDNFKTGDSVRHDYIIDKSYVNVIYVAELRRRCLVLYNKTVITFFQSKPMKFLTIYV